MIFDQDNSMQKGQPFQHMVLEQPDICKKEKNLDIDVALFPKIYMKLLEENRENLGDFVFVSEFLDKTPKHYP